MQFTTKNAESVIIKARGKFISKAVDIAEVSKTTGEHTVGMFYLFYEHLGGF